MTAARKKSQKRQRTKESKIRWLDAEFNAAAANAKASGLSFSAFIRAVSMARPGASAAQAPSVIDDGLVKQILALCGRHGSHWNQIAYKLNVGDAPRKLQEDIERELVNLREVVALGLEALGKKPRRA
jgi:hypothetical protein